MNFKNSISISLNDLKTFTYQAKLQSFAKTDNKTTLSDQTSVYSFRPFHISNFKGMIYTDMYNGNTIESGQESVTIDLILRWRNQYYGGTKKDYWNTSKIETSLFRDNAPDHSDIANRFPEIVSVFLKKALLNTPMEFPVRGPKEYQTNKVEFEGRIFEGDWSYQNRWKAIPIYNIEDPFASFSGEEIITFNDVEVYWHSYHGGLVRDKYFPLDIRL